MPEALAVAEAALREAEQRAIAGALSSALEAAYGKIQRERMSDVPILNPALKVAVPGMREFGGVWYCALVTPWFINAMALPFTEADIAAWSKAAPGEKVMRQLPAGAFEFICGNEEGIGPYQMCSLFSPVLEFENQETAIATAEAAMNALFDASLNPANDKAAKEADATEAKREASQLSRRALLFGGTRAKEPRS
jgi:[NiFe] hydrogenase assembly HybE family chaperone